VAWLKHLLILHHKAIQFLERQLQGSCRLQEGAGGGTAGAFSAVWGYGVGTVALTSFENTLSVPFESTAVTTQK
jgi:hypothetical protein